MPEGERCRYGWRSRDVGIFQAMPQRSYLRRRTRTLDRVRPARSGGNRTGRSEHRVMHSPLPLTNDDATAILLLLRLLLRVPRRVLHAHVDHHRLPRAAATKAAHRARVLIVEAHGDAHVRA